MMGEPIIRIGEPKG